MSKGIQIVLKCLAILLALGMLGGYVWTRQRAATPEPTAESPINGASEFPVTPATPTLFDTSKSGKITTGPTLFSTSKSGPVDIGVTLVPEEKEAAPTNDDKKVDSDTSPPPTIMPGSKSINGLLFNTSDLKKGQDKIDELIHGASGSGEKAKE